MKHLKALFAAVIACVCLALSACGLSFTEADYDSAAAITGVDKYTRTLCVSNKLNDSYYCTADTFKGIDTVWSKNFSQDAVITVDIALSISAGKAKIVHIDADGTVTTLVECTEEAKEKDETKSLSVKSGRNRLKLVILDGRDLNITVSVSA